jgi:phage baseplate assembly protein W
MPTINDELRGFGFPFRFENGRVAQATGADKLRANIVHILLCMAGERAMRRDYGSGLRQLLHDPNNEPLKAIVQHEVLKAIARWEPRVRIQQLDLTQDDGTLWVRITYTVLQSREHGSIALPVGMTTP